MAISSTLKNIYASAPTSVRYIETLQFSHSTFGKVYYMCNDNQPWRYFLENGQIVSFLPVPFKVIPPTQDGEGNQDMSITLANIGQELVIPVQAAIAKPQEPIRCVYRVYLDKPSTYQQNTPALQMTITGVQISRETISAIATRADVLNREFPKNIYTYELFPGLRR